MNFSTRRLPCQRTIDAGISFPMLYPNTAGWPAQTRIHRRMRASISSTLPGSSKKAMCSPQFSPTMNRNFRDDLGHVHLPLGDGEDTRFVPKITRRSESEHPFSQDLQSFLQADPRLVAKDLVRFSRIPDEPPDLEVVRRTLDDPRRRIGQPDDHGGQV